MCISNQLDPTMTVQQKLSENILYEQCLTFLKLLYVIIIFSFNCKMTSRLTLLNHIIIVSSSVQCQLVTMINIRPNFPMQTQFINEQTILQTLY